MQKMAQATSTEHLLFDPGRVAAGEDVRTDLRWWYLLHCYYNTKTDITYMISMYIYMHEYVTV